MPADYILRECTSISFNIQLFLYECPLQQTDWICVSSATADEPLRLSRVECTACRHSLQHSVGFRLHLCGLLSYDGLRRSDTENRACLWGSHSLVDEDSCLGCYAVSKGRNAYIFRFKSGQHPSRSSVPWRWRTSLLRNAGNYSWHGQTSRQTAVLRMATVGTRDLGFPNERRKKGFINDSWLFLAYGDVRRTCLVGSDEKA